MLDDLKYIHQRDAQDVLGIAERQYSQLTHQFEMPELSGEYSNVVYAAMGGSALSALLSVSWPDYKVPFEVCRQYHIPAYVSDKTLFIAASYSGNTEETLSALAEAEAKNAHIVIIASGGKLADIAKDKSYPLLVIPKAEQPRYAVLFMFRALITILESAGLVDTKDADSQMEGAAKMLEEAVKAWLPTVRLSENPAKKLATELAGKSPAIYAGPLLSPVAYKWKINFNENAKNVAWWNELPEFDHNELTGWTSHPVDKPYGIVELRSNLEHERVQKRFEVGERLLSGQRPAPHVVDVQGKTVLEQLVWALAFGDFVTTYVALLNGVNPAPVDLVEKFKKALDE
jgi:glucose/mannose-6-phosphate isomerase